MYRRVVRFFEDYDGPWIVQVNGFRLPSSFFLAERAFCIEEQKYTQESISALARILSDKSPSSSHEGVGNLGEESPASLHESEEDFEEHEPQQVSDNILLFDLIDFLILGQDAIKKDLFPTEDDLNFVRTRISDFFPNNDLFNRVLSMLGISSEIYSNMIYMKGLARKHIDNLFDVNDIADDSLYKMYEAMVSRSKCYALDLFFIPSEEQDQKMEVKAKLETLGEVATKLKISKIDLKMLEAFILSKGGFYKHIFLPLDFIVPSFGEGFCPRPSPGQIVGPFENMEGYVLLRVGGEEKDVLPDFTLIREPLRAWASKAYKGQYIDEYIESCRDVADIKINDEQVNSLFQASLS